MLLKEGLITQDRIKMILSWRHTEFHVHNEGRVVANDAEGRERLARYLIRPPVSLERLTYDRENQQVSSQGKALTHTYQPLDFLAYVSLPPSPLSGQKYPLEKIEPLPLEFILTLR